MYESSNSLNDVSRRSLLKKSAGTSLGISGLSQTAAAWESVDSGVINKLRRSPEVRSILKELNRKRLPKEGKTRTLTVDGHGEITTTKVEFKYGTLRFGALGENQTAVFDFDDITHPAIPSTFADIPVGTEPILIANGEDVTVSREATKRERDLVLAAVPKRGERATVSTRSDLNGFQVTIAKNTSNVEDLEITQYFVEVPDDDFDPAVRDASNRLDASNPLSVSRSELTGEGNISTQGIKSKLIGDYVEGVLASNLGDELHECGSNCVGCADWIISLALDCRLCGPICSSGATGAGAVLCGVCVYQFCSDVDAMIGCADCIACAVEGNSSWGSPSTPDIPEDIPGL